MRSALKSVIERSLLVSGIPARSLSRMPPDAALVLAYHNVVPPDVVPRGDRSLHLSRDAFARQLDALADMHDVVPLSALVDSAPAARGRRVAITFDDAYLGALTVGLEELSRRGLPATMFVAPALLGTIPWWDALARASRLDASTRDHALTQLAGRGADVMSWAAGRLRSVPGASPSERIATLEELQRAAEYPGLTLAPHTWSHPNLSAIGTRELEEEIARPHAWLKERFPSTIAWLAYPYGMYTAEATTLAERAGYAGAFRVNGGWMRGGMGRARRFELPRYNVPAGLSLAGFRLRLSGVGAGA